MGLRVLTSRRRIGMRFDWRWELAQGVLLAAMAAMAAASWSSAPDWIPVHWNVYGQVDRYGGRVEGLLAIPILAVAMYAMTVLLPRVDPRRESYRHFAGAYAA